MDKAGGGRGAESGAGAVEQSVERDRSGAKNGRRGDAARAGETLGPGFKSSNGGIMRMRSSQPAQRKNARAIPCCAMFMAILLSCVAPAGSLIAQNKQTVTFVVQT